MAVPDVAGAASGADAAGERLMLRWPADEELNDMIRRYYRGEAGLWAAIRARVDDELRRRAPGRGPYHLRLRSRPDGRYDVQIDDAAGYEVGF
jgi:hypothetical protein